MIPVDTIRKLNVYKAFRRRPGRFLNLLCALNLRPVSRGLKIRGNYLRYKTANKCLNVRERVEVKWWNKDIHPSLPLLLYESSVS